MEKRVNDVGGLPGMAVRQETHPATLHQKRVDALYGLLTSPPVSAFRVDSIRRTIESNTAEDYRNFGYYDKWIRAVHSVLIEQQILTAEEIEARMQEIRQRPTVVETAVCANP
jgi:hypothetical protein